MPSLDRSRFIYSLAGVLVAGEWNLATIRAALRYSPTDRPVSIPNLARRIVAAFASKPAFHDLAEFLANDAGVNRAAARGFCLWQFHSTCRASRAARMEAAPSRLAGIAIPKLPTEASLAKWFGVGLSTLQWHGDLAGRNRNIR